MAENAIWQKIRPWAAQLTQMGVAACVRLQLSLVSSTIMDNLKRPSTRNTGI